MSEAGFNRYIYMAIAVHSGKQIYKNNWVKKVIYDFPSIKQSSLYLSRIGRFIFNLTSIFPYFSLLQNIFW